MHVMWITQPSDDMHVSHVMYAQMNNVNAYAKVQYECLNNVSTSLPACKTLLGEVRYVKTALRTEKVRIQCIRTNNTKERTR
jgi:predicted MarR family transcription regulator